MDDHYNTLIKVNENNRCILLSKYLFLTYMISMFNMGFIINLDYYHYILFTFTIISFSFYLKSIETIIITLTGISINLSGIILKIYLDPSFKYIKCLIANLSICIMIICIIMLIISYKSKDISEYFTFTIICNIPISVTSSAIIGISYIDMYKETSYMLMFFYYSILLIIMFSSFNDDIRIIKENN